MAKLSIDFPSVPSVTDEAAIIQALGRLTIGWSSSEFYLVLILQRLMASADLESEEDIAQAETGKANMSVDTNAVFALYFAVESSRGRRHLVESLAEARLGESHLVQSSFDEIKSILADHAKIASSRNKYAHTAMGRRDDGAYILLDEKMMLHRVERTTRLKNPQIRANNNRVDAKQIDDVTDRLDAWISRARDLLQTIETKPKVGSHA